MDYIEMEHLNEAFLVFLTNQKNKEELKIKYYRTQGGLKDYDYAFIGYETFDGGFHGIHYNKQRNTYYFGTRNQQTGLRPSGLSYSQEYGIPSQIKETMRNVATEKKSKNIKRSAWKD